MQTDHELLIRFADGRARGAHALYQDETHMGVLTGPAVPLNFASPEFARLVVLACCACDEATLEAIRYGVAIRSAQSDPALESTP